MGYDENGGNAEELVRMTSLDETDPPEYLICYLSSPTQKEWMTCEAFHEKYTDVIETYDLRYDTRDNEAKHVAMTAPVTY